MKISQVIQLHEKNKLKISLKDYLCDGYMLKNNRILANTRIVLRHLGFRLSRDALPEYRAFPLLSLDKILQTKTIPYSDTVTALSERYKINKNGRLEVRLTEEMLFPNRSPLFHESLHCISFTVLNLVQREMKGRKRSERGRRQQLEILEILLMESIANASEQISSIFVKEGVDRFLFEKLCSQMIGTRYSRALMKKMCKNYGFHKVYQGLVYGFLLYNFHFEKFPKSIVRKALKLFWTDEPDQKSLNDFQKLFYTTQEMSRAATIVTPYYSLVMNGKFQFRSIEHYARFLDFDVLETLARQPDLLKLTSMMSEILFDGLNSTQLKKQLNRSKISK